MIHVVKIGGNIIDNKEALQQFLTDFASVKGSKILIHGGGKIATEVAGKLGIAQQLIDGRRITDAQTLDVITMVYAGLINKNMIASLQSLGCESIGVCGSDGNLISAQKRVVKDIDYGFVGDHLIVNTSFLTTLLQCGKTVVLAPITHDNKGQLLNTNADTIAESIASALAEKEAVQLIYCFDKKGVLEDVNDENSVIKSLNDTQVAILKSEGKIHTGMIPKIDNALKTIQKGVQSVIIGHASEIKNLVNGIGGTKIMKD
jgi:acetylglutamate kinase